MQVIFLPACAFTATISTFTLTEVATAVPQVFLSHLHSDHHADLASLYVNAMFGRKVPLEIWGPSSEKPELGLAASIEGLRQVESLCLCAVLQDCTVAA